MKSHKYQLTSDVGVFPRGSQRHQQTRDDVVLLGTQQGILPGKQLAAGTPQLQPFPNPLSPTHPIRLRKGWNKFNLVIAAIPSL